MAFDFPDVPVVDEIVTFGEASYKWNLEKWMRQPKGATSVAIIHDGSLQGDGTAAFPLSIANSIIDTQGFVRAGSNMAPTGESRASLDMVEALSSRIAALENEISVLRGRRNRPLSPLERAASRSSRRKPI